ncbi:MAG: phosphatidate cytidylyltransferase [Halioglobus sp.]|nr:phosphatidate cytidylyltransferase [Halioglobus sp.]
MLKQRIITGLIMAGGFLAAVFLLPLPVLAAVFAVIVALGAWEWARLSGWVSTQGRVFYALLVLAAIAVIYWHIDLGGSPRVEDVQPFLGLACLWWSFAILWIRGYPGSAVLWRTRFMRSLMGLLILVLGWVAAVFLLCFPQGPLMLISMVLIVAVADIGAYFTGTNFGKHKLAPDVSPGKTWEGFLGGLAACVLLGIAYWQLLPLDAAHIGLASVLAVTVVTALVSVVGDLTVSMVKRESGVKDSGSLLPGHGGLLDRLDSLCSSAPVFALGLILAGW